MQSVLDLFLGEFLHPPPDKADDYNEGLASLVSSLALLIQTEAHVSENLPANEIKSVKAAIRAAEDALEFCKGMPGVGRHLVDIADASLSMAEGLVKNGMTVLLGSSVAGSVGEGRLFDLGNNIGGRDQALVALVAAVVQRLKALEVGDVSMVPCGWAVPVNETSSTTHCLLLVVGRISSAEYSVAVCNTRKGRELHASRVGTPSAQDETALSVYLSGVPPERLLDGSFWYMVLRPLVYPSPLNSAENVYKLFPFLNQQPLWCKEQTAAVPPADWPPSSALQHASLGACVFGPAMRAALRMAGLCDARAAALAHKCRHALANACVSSLSAMPACSLSAPDAAHLKQIARSVAGETAWLANVASFDSTELAEALALCDRLARQVQRCTASPAPAPVQLATPSALAQGSCWPEQLGVGGGGVSRHPGFGALRKGLDVESLVGKGGVASILRPVNLAAVARPIESISEAATALRQCVHACTLLANQAAQIRNTYSKRLSLITHLFTQVLPLPLPFDSPEAKAGKCFWAAAPMRYETQLKILEDLRLLGRHLATACLSLRTTRSVDAARLCAFTALLAVADAVLRIAASDFPSPVSVHYNGTCSGPVTAFAVDVGDFVVESETLLFMDPYLATARALCVEYLERRRQCVAGDHILLTLDLSPAPSAGDCLFVDQLCVHMGFERVGSPSEVAADYMSAANPELIDHYPELGAFRDIVLMLKVLMLPSLDLLPPLQRWRMSDSALKWTSKKVVSGAGLFGGGGTSSGEYHVTAFNDFHLKPHERGDRATKGVLGGFIGIFKGGPKPRAPESGAAPSLVAGESVKHEDDVLHILTLPSFSNTLPPSDVERLIQMLCVPYMRIPLILGFLADESRLHALVDKDLQNVVDSCLFEPGAWQAVREEEATMPQMIPDVSRKCLGTPAGLLVNELVNAPAELMTALSKMLDVVLDLDTGNYYGPSTPAILYVLRMATRVCQYAGLVVRNFQWRALQAGGGAGGVMGVGERAYVRGLCPPAHRAHLVAELNTLKNAVEAKAVNRGWSMLESWRLKCLKATPPAVAEACVCLTHQSYLFYDAEHVSKHQAVDAKARGGVERALEEALCVKAVETIVTAEIYLTHNYTFDMELEADHGAKQAKKEHKRGKATGEVDRSLLVSQLEVVDLYSRHRTRILRWIQGNGEVEAGGGLGASDELSKTPDQLLEHVILSLTTAQSMGKSWADKDGCARRWSSIDAPHGRQLGPTVMQAQEMTACVGRMCPDTERASYADTLAKAGQLVAKAVGAKQFEEWLRLTTTAAVGTELNLQLGTFTLRSNQTQLLSPDFYKMADFKHVFKATERLQCAVVHTCAEREWVRLVALRHDLLLWSPDPRTPTPRFSVPYVRQGWVGEVLALVPLSLVGALRLDTVDVSSAKLVRGSGVWAGCVKEFVICRKPRFALVYNVEEHGRRFYRRLVFATHASHSLHCMRPLLQAVQASSSSSSSDAGAMGGWVVSGGDAGEASQKAASLVIRRNLSARMGQQTLIPERLLRGLIPDALLDDYVFWQVNPHILVP